MKNYASDCWTIVPVTVEESCQPLLNNRASNYWRTVPVTVQELCQWLLEEFCQWLLMNRANDCWAVVSAVFFFFLTYFGRILTSFSWKTYIIIDYFNSGSQLSKLQDYWLIIIFIFSLYTRFTNFRSLSKAEPNSIKLVLI